MDMNTVLLALASDARLASVPVRDVLNAVKTTATIGITTFITAYRSIAVHNMNVLCSVKDIYTINGTRVAIGNPCFVSPFGKLHICQNTIVAAEATRAIAVEIVSDNAIKNAIYRD